ncbi:MAG: penicillin-binding protein [Bacteroidales bacterium]|nr:penicillin-binding protein [Bacteroidales bacterium]
MTKKTSSTYRKKNNLNKKLHRTNRKKKQNSFKRRLLNYLFIVFLTVIILTTLLFVTVFLGFTGHVPTTAQLLKINNPQASEVYSEDGKLLGRYYVENRSNVSFNDISPNVINALIATEDARFYEHRGIDEIALLRVLVKTIIFRDRSAGGGSTLSQQIAKNLFPRNDIGILSLPVNKLRESIIAYRLERIYSKEEILTLYLNTVPFAENIFGVEIAAERFFSKSPKELTVEEAAVLVGMLKANNVYNPRTHPLRSQERRNVVISQMASYGYLSEEEAEEIKARPMEIKYRRISYNEGPAPYFLEMMKPELIEWCAENMKENGEQWNLFTDGLQIKTTINSDFQFYARQSVNEHMTNLQKVFDNHWANADPWRGNSEILERAVQRTDRYLKMSAQGISEAQIEKAFSQKTKMHLFTWEGMKEVEATPLDSVKHYLRLLNTGFLALNPFSGAVKAWVGGTDFRFFKYDHVLSERQTGSTFKPFVYLAALENGLSPFEYYPNEKKTYKNFNDWSPSNSDGIYEGFFSMEGALSKSINTVAVEILMQTGVENVISTARNIGIEGELPPVPSLALGVTSLNLRDLLASYSVFINGGKKIDPYYLISIHNNEGELLEEFEPPGSSPAFVNNVNCRIIVHMLEKAINEGTGTKIRTVYKIPGDFAGKTGTTQNQSDGWFVGMTPSLVTGCWVGAEDPGIHFRSITYGQGAYTALPVVGKFFHKLYSDPRYKNLQNHHFPEMDPELIAGLDIPAYREMLEIEKIDDVLDRLFTGNRRDKKLEEIRHPGKKEDKKNIWQSIKGIFKKK